MNQKIILGIVLICAVIGLAGGNKMPVSCQEFTKISIENETRNEEPAIFEENIVWTTEDNVVLYDKKMNRTKEITSTFADKDDGRIFQDRIMWVEFGEEAQIYSCEISKSGNHSGCGKNDGKQKITNESGLKREISIFLNKTVWEQFDGNDFEIVMCDFSLNGKKGGCRGSDEKIRITNNSIDDRNAEIFGDYIVWESGESPNINIDYYDFFAQQIKQFITMESDQQKPQLFYENGDYFVVYASNQGATGDIFYKKIGNNSAYSLTNGKFDEWNPIVNNFGEKKIFWLSSKLGYSHAEGISGRGWIDASFNQTFKQDNLALFNRTIVFEAWNQSQSEIWMAVC